MRTSPPLPLDGIDTHRLVDLLDGLGGMACLIDRTGGVVDAGPSCRDVLGVAREEVIGQPLADFAVAAEDDRIDEEIAKAFEQAETRTFRLRTAGSAIPARWLEMSLRRMPDRGRLLGCVRDVTRRCQDAESLARCRQDLRVVQRIGLLGTWELDLRNGLLHWSDEIYRIFGLTPETFDYTQAGFYRTVHPDDLGLIQEADRQVRKTGAPLDVEHRIVLPDGTVRWVHELAVRELDDLGQPWRVSGTVQDITARKHAEHALRMSEELFASAFHAAPYGMILAELDQRITRMNRAGRHLLGHDASSIQGLYLDDLPHPDFLRDQQAGIQRMFGGDGGRFQRELRFLHRDGHPVWVNASIALVHGIDSQPARLILQFKDIEDRKRAEKKARQAMAQCQALSHRLVELQEREQRRISRELHDRIGQELTALGITLTIIERALSGEAATAVAGQLQDARALVQSTTAAMRSLIAELRPIALDDFGLIAGLQWQASRIGERAGIPVVVHGAEPEPRLPGRVEQALFRIAQEALHNAIKHSNAARIDVHLRHGDEAVELEIADEGRGFIPGDETFAIHPEHWGLAMMRERAEAIGADLHVDSSPGQGTRVRVVYARDGHEHDPDPVGR